MNKEKNKGVFSKFKNFINKTNEENNNLGYFYGIIFVFLIIFALIIKFTSNNNNNNTNNNVNLSNQNNKIESVINYKEVLSDISDNYELDISVNKYYFNEYVNVKVEGTNKLINVKKFDSNNTYSQNDKIDEDIDLTFVYPQNILKLLDYQTYSSENKYMFETNKWIELYNEINNTNIEKIISGEIVVEFLSNENNEFIIQMDLTNLYKNLNYNYNNVIYNMKFYNINKIDLSNNNTSFVEESEINY